MPLHLLKDQKITEKINDYGIELVKNLDLLTDENRSEKQNPQKLFANFKSNIVKVVREHTRVGVLYSPPCIPAGIQWIPGIPGE
jgi:hypothetical protein